MSPWLGRTGSAKWMQTWLDSSVLEGVEFLFSINLKVQLPYWINLHMDTHTRYRTGAPQTPHYCGVCWKSGISVCRDTAVTIAAGPLQPGGTDGAGRWLILRYVLLSNVTQHRRTLLGLPWDRFNCRWEVWISWAAWLQDVIMYSFDFFFF